jgi:hypothetical protein
MKLCKLGDKRFWLWGSAEIHIVVLAKEKVDRGFPVVEFSPSDGNWNKPRNYPVDSGGRMVFTLR